MDSHFLEPFVDADQAARFLVLTRRHVLELARAGSLPGHPIGAGARRVWRFRLSELAAAVGASHNSEIDCVRGLVPVSTEESRSRGPRERSVGFRRER